MGTSVLDGRPTPAARVGRFHGCRVQIVCTACGRHSELLLRAARTLRRRPDVGLIHNDTRFWQMEQRLRCRLHPKACGGPGRILGVDGWKDGGDGGFSGRQRWWRGMETPRLL